MEYPDLEGDDDDGEVDLGLVVATVLFVNGLERKSTIDLWLTIGRHLVDAFWHGDLDAANAPRAGALASYKAFLDDTALTVDPRELRRAKALAKQVDDLRFDIGPYDLSYSHHVALMRVKTVARKRLLAIEAVGSAWGVRRLNQIIDLEVPPRDLVNADVRRVRALGDAMAACTDEQLASLPDGVFDVEVAAAEEAAKALLVRLRHARAARAAKAGQGGQG